MNGNDAEKDTVVRKVRFDDGFTAGELFGPGNANLEYLAELTGTSIQSRGSTATIFGTDDRNVDLAEDVLLQCYHTIETGGRVDRNDVDYALRILRENPQADLEEVFSSGVRVGQGRRTVSPKTINQQRYMEAIDSHDLVFGIGPAGTGKTYLAVAMAVARLMDKAVKRIILTRPAVEAGEKLGFLPGDMVEKVNPYLRPLYDALHDMLDFRKVQEMLAAGVIEIAPLAFMRGRTLNDAFVILDEAQNTTPEQMKMFLTRLGFGSKGVVTGDPSQVDLPQGAPSGLLQATDILRDVEGIKCIRFKEPDVIRHPLVGRIVGAYENFESKTRKPE